MTLPDLALVAQLLPGALGIALMSFTESIAAGRAFARPGDSPINANRELIATGVANLGGALFGAMPAGGGTSQTVFFANAQQVGEDIRALVERHKPRVLALDMSRVPDIEYSALHMLLEGEKRATEQDATLWLVGLNPGVLEVVRRSGLADILGPERLLYNSPAVIEHFQALAANTDGKAR